ncbi:cytochrome P450 [Pseudomonas borbori]
MKKIPGGTLFDSSLALLSEGYRFISNRCERYQSPIFATRLMLQRTICMRGEAAAALFYDQQLFTRKNAAPRLLKKTLFGIGGVQGLDGTSHLQRKQLFMHVLAPERVELLVQLAEQQWLAALQRWEGQPQVVMLPEIETLLCKAVCRWAGVPLADGEAAERREQMAAMIDGTARLGWGHFQARAAQKAAQTWAANLVVAQRGGQLHAPAESALAVLSLHRDDDGELLEEEVAAVELLNLLRPTVAVARFIVFALLELHRHPEWNRRLVQSDEWLRPFTQEVRRLYAFFPFVPARVRQDFEWQGYRFDAGTRVLLDLYGTNRDPATWPKPDDFLPERFNARQGSDFDFITQGGATAQQNHRCPGEDLAIALIENALRLFSRRMRYTVATHDIKVSSRRIPMLPSSQLILSEITAVRA